MIQWQVDGRQIGVIDIAECAALVPDGHDPVWKLPLGDHGLVQGGLWLGGKLYVATKEGMLFAIREQREEPHAAEISTASPAEQTSAAGQTGLVWNYKFDSDILSGPFGPDFDKEFYILTKQNTLVARDGSVFIVSDQSTISLYNPQGEILWEEPLNSDPQGYAWDQANESLYLTDEDAVLYKFNQAGLAWKFKSSAAPYSASSPVTGPDGSVYYVVTNRRSGNNVIQWRYGAGGFEILQTASWNASQASASSVFGAYVDENSVIWLYYRDLIAWLKPDGGVIATRQSYSALNSLLYHEVKDDQVITTQCIRQATASTLTCAAYTSDSKAPFWESRVEGVPEFAFGFGGASLASGNLLVASGDTLYRFYVGEPPG